MNSRLVSWFYLTLALLGGGFSFYHAIVGSLQQGGFSPLDFIQSTWTDNLYARSLTFDFWTAAFAGSFFMVAESVRLGMKNLWVFVLLTFLVAFAFGFPLFLFFRERHIQMNNPLVK